MWLPIIIGAATDADLVALGAKTLINKLREREERRATPIEYPDGFSHEEFVALVQSEAREIKRIKGVEVFGADVLGTVRSQSGISEWTFTIDFNDYGNLTGEYWIWSTNKESSIPETLATRIHDAVICQSKER